MKERSGIRALLRGSQPLRLFMLVLVLGASFPVMFVGGRGRPLQLLLIGFWFSEAANANAGRKTSS